MAPRGALDGRKRGVIENDAPLVDGAGFYAKHDFVIGDFEGEPSRLLEERRAMHSPLRDVAGMLRSFGYPTAVAPQREIAPSPANRARAVVPLAAWRAQAEAFLAGYREAIANISSYPANADLVARLIDVFTLGKALYELRYELENRPDWVGIPLAAVLEQIADGAL